MAEDAGAALIVEAFDLYNEYLDQGDLEREQLIRVWALEAVELDPRLGDGGG